MGTCLSNLCRNFSRTRRRPRHEPRRLICPLCGENFSRSSQRLEDHFLTCQQLNNFSENIEPNIIQIKPPSRDAPYETKITWLRNALNTVRVPWIQDSKKLTVNRQQLLQYSYEQLLKFTPHDMHKEFNILFEGEISQDAGGLTKEWISALTVQLLSLETGLFVLANADNVSYIFTPEWKKDKMYLYNFAGMVFGKALFEGIPIPCHLNLCLFKQLVGAPVTFDDMVFFDSSLYSSLKYVAENDINGILFEKFCVGKYELKEGGREISVTNDNKLEYIKLRIEYETMFKTKEPLDAFLEGFYKVVPKELLMFLQASELELALCGMPYIDVMDWEENTVYRGFYSRSHTVVRWFWDVLACLTQEQLSQLLMFCTGTSRLPVEGFRALRTLRGEVAKFTIESLGLEFLYPRAHTCFNRLDIPMYGSKATLENALLYVIENHCAGFGME